MEYYLGSCRYMELFKYHCPIRLHSTRDVLFFLKNMENILQIKKELPDDIFYTNNYNRNPKREKKWNEYIQKDHDYIISNMSHIINLTIEISSKKQYFYMFEKKKIPLVEFYVTKDLIKKYDLQYHILTDDEIKSDLIEIKKIIKNKFNKNCLFNVITHINIKSKKLNNLIASRNELVNILETHCKNILIDAKLIKPYTIIQQINSNYFIEDILKHGRHFEKHHEKYILEYVKNQIS